MVVNANTKDYFREQTDLEEKEKIIIAVRTVFTRTFRKYVFN